MWKIFFRYNQKFAEFKPKGILSFINSEIACCILILNQIASFLCHFNGKIAYWDESRGELERIPNQQEIFSEGGGDN